MKRFTALLCALLVGISAVFAQTDNAPDNSNPDDSNKSSIAFNMNQPGDQYIKIALMVSMPLNFGGSFPLYRDGQLSTGGAGELGYHRFIASWFAVGIDVNFGYNPTIGSNIFTYVPFILNMTFQPTFHNWEFPITLGFGGAVESYLNRTYFPGLVLKPEAGVFYRATPSWSFGIGGNLLYMPQWYVKDPENNDYGVFGQIEISARYHF
jgi:hypothetical protein